jgi:hypothetical protein
VLGTDHDVSQLARADSGGRGVHWKRQHVGGSIAAAVLPVELADALRVHEGDGEVALVHAGRRQRGKGRSSELGRSVDEVELDYQTCWRLGGRSGGACFSAYSL